MDFRRKPAHTLRCHHSHLVFDTSVCKTPPLCRSPLHTDCCCCKTLPPGLSQLWHKTPSQPCLAKAGKLARMLTQCLGDTAVCKYGRVHKQDFPHSIRSHHG